MGKTFENESLRDGFDFIQDIFEDENIISSHSIGQTQMNVTAQAYHTRLKKDQLLALTGQKSEGDT